MREKELVYISIGMDLLTVLVIEQGSCSFS